MSALVVIVCDLCGDQGNVGNSPHEARADMSAWSRRQGMDLCPLCTLLSQSHERLTATSH
jgi:hypothetical protein